MGDLLFISSCFPLFPMLAAVKIIKKKGQVKQKCICFRSASCIQTVLTFWKTSIYCTHILSSIFFFSFKGLNQSSNVDLGKCLCYFKIHECSSAVFYHQVAVNPLVWPHTWPPCREKMRCNPPSMKSAFLLFSSTALPLIAPFVFIHLPVQMKSPFNDCSYWSVRKYCTISWTMQNPMCYCAAILPTVFIARLK